jgi:hypothetical protein
LRSLHLRDTFRRPAFTGRRPRAPRMNPALTPYVAPAILLKLSNVFMKFACYGHLKFTTKPLALVILAR